MSSLPSAFIPIVITHTFIEVGRKESAILD